MKINVSGTRMAFLINAINKLVGKAIRDRVAAKLVRYAEVLAPGIVSKLTSQPLRFGHEIGLPFDLTVQSVLIAEPVVTNDRLTTHVGVKLGASDRPTPGV